MTPLFTFVLGLLIGWLIEWLIDYFYWRRRSPGEASRTPVPVSESQVSVAREHAPRSATKPRRDDLKVIKGIGPVIERKLNEAEIYTFEQLGNLTSAQLRRILGNSIERLSDEESLLQQARDFARRK
jgi:predicted flap endonuclease-1-like 5' DNA nuclease